MIVLQLLLTLLLGRFQLFSQVEALQISLNADLARTVGVSVTRALQRPVQSVQGALRQWSLIEQQPAFRLAALQQLVDTADAADVAYVLDRRGKVLAAAAPFGAKRSNLSSRVGLDMSKSLMVRALTPGTTNVSPVFLSPITDQPTIAVSGLHESGEVLVVEINLSLLTQTYGGSRDSNGSEVLIVDASGLVLADRDGLRAGQSAMLPAPAIQTVQSGNSGVISLWGQTWLATSYAVVETGLDWRVLVMRPLNEVYRPIVAIVVVSLAGTGLVLVLTLLVLLAGVRKVVLETEVLSTTARALQIGSKPPAGALTVLELNNVDTSLREMAATLLERENSLRQANEALELRVAERTRHLEAANSSLETALTKLETAQTELVHAAKMSALSGMVAGVAHELNTPMGNARMTATALIDTAGSIKALVSAGPVSRTELLRTVDLVQEGSDLIDRSLQRASDIVQAFKQVAVDQASRRRRVFLLRDVLQENVLLLSPRLKKAGVSVDIEAPPDLELQSFPGDLGQVISNLLENAMVHAYQDGSGGKIRITALPTAGERLLIQVQDFGRGIPAEALQRVFDPFYTTRLGQGGSGLGLAIAYNMVVTSLGGKISVSSTLDRGTCFSLDLPLVAPDSPHKHSH